MCADRSLFEPPQHNLNHYSNKQLDDLRQVTDSPADELIEDFFCRQSTALEPGEFLQTFMNYRIQRPSEKDRAVSIPRHLLDELAERCPLPSAEPENVRRGQKLFQDHGPEMLMILCCYSLPAAYCAAKGAHVLHETGYLEHRVARRLVETTQMVIDVMQPGGLGPGGNGLRSAHEIRLMHAAIRYLIDQRANRWDPRWGRPINQEDLAGTLMTFSYVVLDGLSKLGIEVERSTQEAYLAAWCSIGQSMGVRDELLPSDMLAAQELTWRIHDRQMKGSDVGRDLTQALLATMQSHLPLLARPLCASMVRVFLEPDLADAMDVPRNLLLDNATVALQRLYGLIDDLFHIAPLGLGVYRAFSHLVIDALTEIGRGHDKRADFDLPTALRTNWKIPKPR